MKGRITLQSKLKFPSNLHDPFTFCDKIANEKWSLSKSTALNKESLGHKTVD